MISYVIIGIFVLLAIVMVVINMIRRNTESDKTLNNASHVDDAALDENTRRNKLMIIGLVMLIVGVLVFVFLNERGIGTVDEKESGGFNVATMISVWIAIFVPAISLVRKRIKKSYQRKRGN